MSEGLFQTWSEDIDGSLTVYQDNRGTISIVRFPGVHESHSVVLSADQTRQFITQVERGVPYDCNLSLGTHDYGVRVWLTPWHNGAQIMSDGINIKLMKSEADMLIKALQVRSPFDYE